MTTNSELLDGLLLVDKPGSEDAEPLPIQDFQAKPPSSGRSPYLLTSHDIVARVRRWSGQRRIGHTGTLDPMASGLMLLCLGRSTRLVEFYQHQPKCYQAKIALGGATDTDDATGKLLASFPVPPLDLARIDQALDRFRGVVQQQAPLYSAIKQEGETLYRRARRGEQIEAPVRTVVFHRIDLVDFESPNRIMLDIECSAGAYIRSLARDLGKMLGTAAYLQALRRTAIGQFALVEAHTLDEIEVVCREGRVADLLLPPGDRLPLPDHHLDDDALRRLGFGQIALLMENACDPERQLAAARDRQGRLVGIMHRLGESAEAGVWQWKAEKWLQ